MCCLSKEKKRLRDIAKKYQSLSHALWLDGPNHPESWDCDVRVDIVVTKMKEDGLINDCELIDEKGTLLAKGDYVYERGTVKVLKEGKWVNGRHVRIRMRGNFIVDPGMDSKTYKMKRTWPVKIIWSSPSNQ